MTLVETQEFTSKKIAVVLPCYNEEAAIVGVIRDFQAVLPTAEIYVCDNNSTDKTADLARETGANVLTERLQGKGNAVRRIFSEIDADCYVMADGDGTYEAAAAPRMVSILLNEKLDMVVGCRKSVEGEKTYRPGHSFGNKFLTGVARVLFGRGYTDMLTGYRVFSRRFVKSFPVVSEGFEIETEITIHSLNLNIPACEVSTDYFERTEGTESKLSTYRDGWRILMMIFRLFRDVKPLLFFSLCGALFAFSSVALAIPVVLEFLETGLVDRLPTAILCTGLMIIAVLSLFIGFILDSIARGRLEAKKIAYLQASEA